MPDSRPLFAHPRLIAAALVGFLTIVTSAALYLRPLSGDTQFARAHGKAETISAVLGVRG
jgi:hypothetical protein